MDRSRGTSTAGRMIVWLAVGTAFAVAVACGGDEADTTCPVASATTDGGDGAATPADASTTPLASGFCAAAYGSAQSRLERCCTLEDKATVNFIFGYGGIAAIRSWCDSRIAASSAARIKVDPVAEPACLAWLQTYFAPACGQPMPTATTDEIAAQAENCKKAYEGTVAQGGTCRLHEECADGLRCNGGSSEKEGVCGPPPALGEPCDASLNGTALSFRPHPICAGDAYCASSKCTAKKADGAVCAEKKECLSGSCHLGKCGPGGPGGADAVCVSNDDCQPAFRCATSDGGKTCQEKRAAGSPCATVGLGGDECKGLCVAAGEAGAGVCRSFCGSN